MDYDDAPEDVRRADVKTKANGGDPYSEAYYDVDHYNSPSHVAKHYDDDVDSDFNGNFDGPADHRSRGRNSRGSFNPRHGTSYNRKDDYSRHARPANRSQKDSRHGIGYNGVSGKTHSTSQRRHDDHRPYAQRGHADEADDFGRYRSNKRSRSRSRSPYQHGRRSRSPPFRRDRSRSPYRNDRSKPGDKHENKRRRGDQRHNDLTHPGENVQSRDNIDQRGARQVRFETAEGTRNESRAIPTDNPEPTPLAKEDEDRIIEERRRRFAEIRAKFAETVRKDQQEKEEPNIPLAGTEEKLPTVEMSAISQEHTTVSEDRITDTRPSTLSQDIKPDDDRLSVQNMFDDTSAVGTPDGDPSRQGSLGPNYDGTNTFAIEDVAAPDYQDDLSSINQLAEHRRSDVNLGETGAAEYDEMMMQDDDRLKRLNIHSQPVKQDAAKHTEEEEDDDFDMFAEDDSLPSKPVQATSTVTKKLDASLLVDDIDDSEGYLKFRLGEVLDGRYQVTEVLGKGMFANVLRAKDLQAAGRVVAVKLLRNNEAMRKAGALEIRLLQKLNENDPRDSMHIVRFLSQFDYKNHLSMVFENLHLNLRDVLKKFGRDEGLHITALRSFSFQLFKGLLHLKKCEIIHADLKPDNILVTPDLRTVKICDLGTAADTREPLDVTSYIASRFYRPPEVILGMKYDYGIDMWAIGCTLYELYTGVILFTGRSNNQMLKLMMEAKGHFSLKFLKRGEFAGKHFNDNGSFVSIETDPKTHKEVIREISSIKPERGRDIKSRIVMCANAQDKNELKEASMFGELIEKCLVITPDRRLTPEQALKHEFIHRPLKNVAQPKFTPSTLLGGGKPSQVRPVRKRIVATDYMHEEVAQSPTSAASPVSSAPATPAAIPETTAPQAKRGFRKATMIKM